MLLAPLTTELSILLQRNVPAGDPRVLQGAVASLDIGELASVLLSALYLAALTVSWWALQERERNSFDTGMMNCCWFRQQMKDPQRKDNLPTKGTVILDPFPIAVVQF